MATAADVINDLLVHYPGIPSARRLPLLQEAHNAVLGAVRLRAIEEVDITLVANQQEYTLASNILRIWSALYLTAADQGRPLEATSIDVEDQERPTWPIHAAATPNRWYEVGPAIGFIPKPLTPTTLGYPIVRLRVSTMQTLATDTVMPAMVPTYAAWVAYACWRWAWSSDRPNLPYWQAQYENEMAYLIQQMNQRQTRFKATVNPDFGSISNY